MAIEYYPVYSLSMVNWLTHNGHDILSIVDSDHDPSGKVKVCMFAKTPELQQHMAEFNNRKENCTNVKFSQKTVRDRPCRK